MAAQSSNISSINENSNRVTICESVSLYQLAAHKMKISLTNLVLFLNSHKIGLMEQCTLRPKDIVYAIDLRRVNLK